MVSGNVNVTRGSVSMLAVQERINLLYIKFPFFLRPDIFILNPLNVELHY